MQSAKCSAFMPPFAKQKGEFGEEADAAILPMASRLASLSTLHPVKKGFIVRKHGRTLGGQIKEIFTNDNIWCIGKQSQDMLSSCELRAGSRSVSSGGCSQCHLLSTEWQHRANLNSSTPEEYRCQPSQKRTWSWYEQKVFDQSEVEPQASWKSRTRKKELRCCWRENDMQHSMQSPREGAALWFTRSVDGILCCSHCLLIDFIVWQREKELVTAVLPKPAKTWEFPEQRWSAVLTQWNCFWSCQCPLSSLERQLFQNIRLTGWHQVFQYYNILW